VSTSRIFSPSVPSSTLGIEASISPNESWSLALLSRQGVRPWKWRRAWSLRLATWRVELSRRLHHDWFDVTKFWPTENDLMIELLKLLPFTFDELGSNHKTGCKRFFSDILLKISPRTLKSTSRAQESRRRDATRKNGGLDLEPHKTSRKWRWVVCLNNRLPDFYIIFFKSLLRFSSFKIVKMFFRPH